MENGAENGSEVFPRTATGRTNLVEQRNEAGRGRCARRDRRPAAWGHVCHVPMVVPGLVKCSEFARPVCAAVPPETGATLRPLWHSPDSQTKSVSGRSRGPEDVLGLTARCTMPFACAARGIDHLQG